MGVFAGIRFLCRAGPMCPAAGYAFFGGAHGPRPTGRYVEPRETGRRGRRPLRNDRERDGGTSYPKGICSAALHGRTPSPMGCMGGTANGGEKCFADVKKKMDK